jgi:hypothetical protein
VNSFNLSNPRRCAWLSGRKSKRTGRGWWVGMRRRHEIQLVSGFSLFLLHGRRWILFERSSQISQTHTSVRGFPTENPCTPAWVRMRGFPTVSEASRWSRLGSTGKGRAFLSIGLKIFDHQTDVEPHIRLLISW